MSLLLGLVTRFSYSTLHTFRPKVFFLSTATLFDNSLLNLQTIVKAQLKEHGISNILNTASSNFTKNDLQLLKVSLQPAFENEILPNCVEDTSILEKYALPDINSKTISDKKFNIKNLIEISDNHVKAFIKDLHEVVKNLGSNKGMNETETNTLVCNLLVRIIDMHYYPLRLSLHSQYRLHILGQPYITARPKFVINKDDISMIVVKVEDKHLKNKNFTSTKGYGETQLVAEILACGDENMRQIARIAPQPDVITDQTIFAIRIISTYFTFYKTVIPATYWKELESGLPQKQSIVIKKWPGDNCPEAGFDIAEPGGRRKVLIALSKIRQFLLE
ncbi:hypothetical protein Glove_88g19 [Diversispora epigaea]|uniref:Uncharacterized protein n=1 Tax=Diversispora epigaea TaxID=1348612 RepID=A0A397JEV6_9GLOM|nr:hypothetical protein Glove_88g19 [Diversispora epigaea]